MTSPAALAILGRVFTRVYRSFGQYLAVAWPVLDVDEEFYHTVIKDEKKLAEALGAHLYEQQGYVDPGNFPLQYGDVHYLNASRISRDWLGHQQLLVAALERDIAALPADTDARSRELCDQVLQRERETLAKLRDMSRRPAAVA